jgi:hypothetical protein
MVDQPEAVAEPLDEPTSHENAAFTGKGGAIGKVPRDRRQQAVDVRWPFLARHLKQKSSRAIRDLDGTRIVGQVAEQ